MKQISKVKILISIIITFFIVFNTVNLDSLYAAEDKSPYDNEELEIKELKKLYHKRINDLFNSKQLLLTLGEKGPGLNEVPKGDDCEENNYTTFCLAMAVAKEYEQYANALQKRKSYVKASEEKDEALEEATIRIEAQAKDIENELITSRKALDTALQAYKELRTAYPMHLQYEETIKSLTKYNKKLSELRIEVENLPKKLIDATTVKCT